MEFLCWVWITALGLWHCSCPREPLSWTAAGITSISSATARYKHRLKMEGTWPEWESCHSLRNFLFNFIMFSISPQFHWDMKLSESPDPHVALRFSLGLADCELYCPLGFGSKIFHYKTWPSPALRFGVILPCSKIIWVWMCVCFCVDCTDDSGLLLWCHGERGGRTGSRDVWHWSVSVQGLRRDARQRKVKTCCWSIFDLNLSMLREKLWWKDQLRPCWSRIAKFVKSQVY